ncbi:hypothetical protein ACVWWI_006644 [Bradyrhizobium sp. USDA 3686]|nr:hypothetical protein [Bradyrhizobium canariense]
MSGEKPHEDYPEGGAPRSLSDGFNRNGKTCLHTIHYYHRFEALDIRVLIEEATLELLMVLHGSGGYAENKIGAAGDVKAIDDLSRGLDGLLNLSMMSERSCSRLTSTSIWMGLPTALAETIETSPSNIPSERRLFNRR